MGCIQCVPAICRLFFRVFWSRNPNTTSPSRQINKMGVKSLKALGRLESWCRTRCQSRCLRWTYARRVLTIHKMMVLWFTPAGKKISPITHVCGIQSTRDTHITCNTYKKHNKVISSLRAEISSNKGNVQLMTTTTGSGARKLYGFVLALLLKLMLFLYFLLPAKHVRT